MATENLKFLITADSTSFNKTLKGVSASITNLGKRLTRSITLPIAAAAVAAVKFASDLEEAMTKTDEVFRGSAGEMKKWAAGASRAFGTTKKDALEFSSTIGGMAKSLGFSIEESASFGRSLTELSADYASFHNTTTEVARTALSAIFTGQAAPLKKFGKILTDVTLSEYALAQGIKTKYSQMGQAEKVQLRYNYIMGVSQSELGDFERTSGNLANTIRISVSSFSDLHQKSEVLSCL